MVKKTHTPRVASRTRNWRYDVIAIGASAGGLQALSEVLQPLPPDFPPILIVQHLDPSHKSQLASLLVRKTGKQVKQAEHDEPILSGMVYIAPPDEHLLVGPGKIQLAHSQLVHFSRPSIDLLFESVAGMYGTRSMGVVLSGSNRDGSMGIRAIKQAGGTTLAQDPKTAEFPVMPRSAIETDCVDCVVPLKEFAGKIEQLCCGSSAKL